MQGKERGEEVTWGEIGRGQKGEGAKENDVKNKHPILYYLQDEDEDQTG